MKATIFLVFGVEIYVDRRGSGEEFSFSVGNFEAPGLKTSARNALTRDEGRSEGGFETRVLDVDTRPNRNIDPQGRCTLRRVRAFSHFASRRAANRF